MPAVGIPLEEAAAQRPTAAPAFAINQNGDGPVDKSQKVPKTRFFHWGLGVYRRRATLGAAAKANARRKAGRTAKKRVGSELSQSGQWPLGLPYDPS